jgi:small-conductance mechanosensitive channel
MDWTGLEPWGSLLLLALLILLISMLVHRSLRRVLIRLSQWSGTLLAILRRCDRPAQALLPLAAWQVVWEGAPEDLHGLGAVQHANAVLLIATITWMCIGVIRGIADGLIARYPAGAADNLSARRIQTQTRVLSRTACGVALVTGLAFILMSFPRARQIGTSLLASAGVAGLVVGIAAKSVFSNLLAGLQIALAQPIRIDDVLIVEGEWGRVEEITATYVVLKIWDERRLIVPLSWFIDHPFQNWTRTTSDILGTVFIWVDYALPVDAIRAQARRLCEASAHWDRRVCLVQVTEAGEQAMQLRVLVSSAASGPNFDLRCEIREGLIDFIAKTFPSSLPVLRAHIGAPADVQQATGA